MTAAVAQWLSSQLHILVRHESAGDCFNDIRTLVDRIERLINRPIPDRFCGVCTGEIGYGYNNERSRRCEARLYAPRNDTWVTCPTCGTTQDIAALFEVTMIDCGEILLTQPEILYAMQEIGQPIGESTLRRWRATGRLKPRGTLQGKPAFHLNDVRTLRNECNDNRLANLNS